MLARPNGASTDPLACSYGREALKPRTSLQERRRSARYASSKPRPKVSASTLGRVPAEKMQPRAPPVVGNVPPSAWIRHSAQDQAWRRRKNVTARSGGLLPRHARGLAHPLPLIVTRELGAAQRTQRGPSRVVARSPRASGPAASDRTARERRLGCCGERRWLRVGPRSAHAPSSSPHQPPSAPALLLSLSSPAARAAADERDRTCRPRR